MKRGGLSVVFIFAALWGFSPVLPASGDYVINAQAGAGNQTVNTENGILQITSGLLVMNNAADDFMRIGNLHTVKYASPSGQSSIAIGSGFSGATYATGQDSIALGSQAKAVGGSVISIGTGAGSANAGSENIAMGSNARSSATGSWSTAIGWWAGIGAGGNNNTAIGPTAGSYIVGELNTAVGPNAGSGEVNNPFIASRTVAVGHNAAASKNLATAIGVESRATALRSISIGSNTSAAESTIADGEDSIAMGTSAQSHGLESIAIGKGAQTLAKGEWAVAIGSASKATGGQSIAMGKDAQASALLAIAMGTASQATQLNSVAIGTDAQALSGQTVAIGAAALAQGVNGISVGTGAQTAGNQSIAIGQASKAKSDSAMAFGMAANATGEQSIAMGEASSAGALNAIALGAASQATHQNALAIGTFARVFNEQAVAIGFMARTEGIDGIAMGTASQALGERSIAIGTGNVVTGARSGAFGDPNIINGADSYSVGNNIRIGSTTNNAFALGNNVYLGADANGVDTVNVSGAVALGNASSVTVQNGVALGSTSVADRSANLPGYVPAGADGAAIAATTKGTLGSVSVGTSAATRQIINVAAGSADSDAVNVAQLKAVQATAVAAGQGWNLSANGDVPSKVAPGDTVQFKDGANIAVTKTGRDVTIATRPDLIATSFTTGATRIDTTGFTIAGGPSVTNLGFDANNTRIVNVAPGQISSTSTDGVNGSQLYNTAASTATHLGGGAKVNADGTVSAPTYNVGGGTYHNVGDALSAVSGGIGSELNELRGDIAGAGASSAALAGLHSMQYDPMAPSQFMLSAGNYRGEWAFALGVSHYPSENFLLHAGVALGGGDHAMANFGATWKIGSGRSKDEIPERYRKGPISSVYVMQQENTQLQSQVQMLTAENAEIKAQLKAIMEKLEMK